MQLDDTSVVVNQWGGLECRHRSTAVRQRVRSNGVKYFSEQCLTCGSEVRAVARTSSSVMRLPQVEVFDEALKDAWHAWCQRYRQRRRQQEDESRAAERAEADAAWWKRYNEYIKSKAWKQKTALVKERANGMCEACGVNVAVHVHHMTYENVGNEILWELRAVCVSCHQRLHPNKDIRNG